MPNIREITGKKTKTPVCNKCEFFQQPDDETEYDECPECGGKLVNRTGQFVMEREKFGPGDFKDTVTGFTRLKK